MSEGKRIEREKVTVQAMLELYCAGRHGRGSLCRECTELLAYAFARLDACRFGAAKPTCRNCPVHCYAPPLRQKIARVMRWSGPRMFVHHPLLAVRHLLDGLRRCQTIGRGKVNAS